MTLFFIFSEAQTYSKTSVVRITLISHIVHIVQPYSAEQMTFMSWLFLVNHKHIAWASIVWQILEQMTLMNGLPYKSGYFKITLLEETLLWLNNHIFRQGQVQTVI